MFARDDDALASVRLEVFGRDFSVFCGVSAQVARRQPLNPARRRDGQRETLYLASLDRQPVIGPGAGRCQRALGDVEAIHLLRSADQSATIYKIARVADRAWPAGQKVGVERE